MSTKPKFDMIVIVTDRGYSYARYVTEINDTNFYAAGTSNVMFICRTVDAGNGYRYFEEVRRFDPEEFFKEDLLAASIYPPEVITNKETAIEVAKNILKYSEFLIKHEDSYDACL